MNKGLVLMTKGGGTIEVAPTAVSDHQRLGFKVVNPQDLADLAKAGLVDVHADPAPYDKLIRVVKGDKIIEINKATVQEYVKAGWSVVDPNDIGDLVTRGLLVPQADLAVDGELTSMSKDGETAEVNPTTIESHRLAGWEVDDQ